MLHYSQIRVQAALEGLLFFFCRFVVAGYLVLLFNSVVKVSFGAVRYVCFMWLNYCAKVFNTFAVML
jgi:hypothetical protein